MMRFSFFVGGVFDFPDAGMSATCGLLQIRNAPDHKANREEHTYVGICDECVLI